MADDGTATSTLSRVLALERQPVHGTTAPIPSATLVIVRASRSNIEKLVGPFNAFHERDVAPAGAAPGAFENIPHK